MPHKPKPSADAADNARTDGRDTVVKDTMPWVIPPADNAPLGRGGPGRRLPGRRVHMVPPKRGRI